MPKGHIIIIAGILSLLFLTTGGESASITFDKTQWATGDMNEQYPSDSAGNVNNSHVDEFYYYERMPMCMLVIDDSLSGGSSSRTYDSTILMLVVAAEGLTGSDSMRIFGQRLTRQWSENGVSWSYYWASSDSSWDNAGGDINSLACMDTIIVDASLATYDTLYFHLDTGFVRYLIETDNFGWLMMAENIVDRGILQLYTEDVVTEAYQPVLTVYYTEGGQPEIMAGRRRRSAM
jgi:hypothetical protein